MSYESIDITGKKFESYVDLTTFICEYGKQNKCVLSKVDSRSLTENCYKIRPNMDLKYKFVHYVCEHGEHYYKSKGHGLRNVKTCKLGCPMYIKVAISRNRQLLEITDANLNHQYHDESDAFFDLYPEQRRLSPEYEKHIGSLLALKANKKRIQDNIKNDRGKTVFVKDLHNLNKKLTKKDNINSLQAAHDYLKSKGATVHLLNKNNTCIGICFYTRDMTEAMNAYPEMIFLHGTYELLDNDSTVMIMIVVDSNKISRVVSIGILADEKYDTVKWYLSTFAEANKEVTSRITCFMADKDLVERKVITELFPTVRTYLCLFHTIKMFSRQINTREKGIHSNKKTKILKILQRLVYSTPSEYDKTYIEFCDEAPKSVISYFDLNWHNIKEQWTVHSMIKDTLGNETNNYLESLNGKLKLIIEERKPLMDFLKSFFI